MRELVEPVERWRAAGVDAALVRAVEVTGFGAGQYDNALVRSAQGETAGAILRRVSDDAVAGAVTALFDDPSHSARELVVALSDPEATAGGLSCGGSARLVVQAAESLPPALWEALASARPVTLATRLRPEGGPATAAFGEGLVAGSLGDARLDERAQAAAHDLLADPRASRVTLDVPPDLTSDPSSSTSSGATPGGRPDRVVIEKVVARTRVAAVGTGEVVEALVDLAPALGWLAEPLGDRETSPGAAGRLGPSDALVVTTHHPRRGPDALLAGLRSGAFFVGALGSRRTQERRAEALRGLGATEDELVRIHGPVGLDLGGRSPAETALAICAEILAVRSGRDLPGLRDRAGPINT